MPRLTYTDADGEQVEHMVRDESVTIGRSAECDIRISGADVARLHVVVESSGNKLRVRDQKSREGTWVGDEKIFDTLLGNGDEFRVGSVSFKVALGGGNSSRREGVNGAEGSSRRFQIPQKEILGGIRLSKMQQTIVKIVCAAVMILCVVGIMWLINYWKTKPATYTRVTKVYVQPEDKPRELIGEAVALAANAREAEKGGSIAVACELITTAKKSADEALSLITELDAKHPGPTYRKLHNLAARISSQAAEIDAEADRLGALAEKAGGN